MRILLITGRRAEADVRAAVEHTEHEVEVDVLPIDIAAFITPTRLSRWMSERAHERLDLILVSGLIRADFSALEHELGVPIRLGPRHAYDLRYVLPMLDEVELSRSVPACVLLRDELKRRALEQVDALERDAGCAFEVQGIKLGGDARMKVLAEVVDADLLPSHELEQRIAYFIGQGADMIDLGISLEGSGEAVAAAVRTAKRLAPAVSIDTLEPELIRAGISAGCDMVLSLRERTIRALAPLDGGVVYVVLPEEGARDRTESLIRNIELAREAGARKLIADPVLEPAGRGCVRSMEECVRVRELCPDVPLFFGVGNVSELLDADSVGVNGLLAALGAELGASILFTPECSDKCAGSVSELARAARMMVLARERNTSPKDLGIDLLVLKEKRRRPSVSTPAGCTKGEESEGYRLDPKGAFTISLTHDGYIVAQHKKGCFKGRTARQVYDAILASGHISLLSHAFYLGAELARAELALRLGRSYAQDDEW